MHPTAPLGHRPELDGLRGLAVLAVVAFHAGAPVGRGGWLGVDVFFVLSGFLITTLLLEERAATGRVALGAFYARRALRLLPAVLALLAVLGLLVAAGLVGARFIEAAPWVLLYIANWQRVVGESTPLVHLWSLSVEEQFYVLWPLALLALLRLLPSPRHHALVLGVAVVGIAVARTGLYATEAISAERAYFGSDLRADALLLGCLLAVARCAGWTERVALWIRRALWPALAGLAVVLVLPASPFGGYGPLLFGPVDGAAFVVVAAVVTMPAVLPWLRWQPLVRLGVLSYAVYLWHLPVMWLLPSPIGRLAVGVPVSLVAALVSRRLIEEPALRLKQRFERTCVQEPVGVVAA